MLSLTHGQPATTTTLGKELAVFISRIERELVLINEINLLAKFSGATGSYAAHKAAFPRANWSVFAKKFNIKKGVTYAQFCNRIKLCEYEDLKEYISRISNGEKNILTSGSPLYFAITSGTTSGTKYIPLTREMMSMQTRAIKELLLLYAYQKNYYKLLVEFFFYN